MSIPPFAAGRVTGDKARHATTGRYFDELADEAEAANVA